ncbi:hypothetical protein [Thiobaca trueperi]|uniref:Uncharacterized protein n=1 Tax=Thiobaca trueperi TaxID=127458 RepID=A0A4R3N9T4_9GAMM|nr:hypothetical protein [Thiobaca trueperi]TCT23759.1 hypothetical protein EDC35_10172 [Thiobaca trueperi]
MRERRKLDREERVALIDRRLAWLAFGGVELTGSADRRAKRQMEAWNTRAEDPRTVWVPTADGGLRWVEPIDASDLETLSNEEVATRLAEHREWKTRQLIKTLAREKPERAFAILDLLIESGQDSNQSLLNSMASGVSEAQDAETLCDAGSRLLRYLDQDDSSEVGGWGFLEWLQSAAKQLPIDLEKQSEFWCLWDRLWSKALASRQSSSAGGADRITAALNAPGGELALTLLERLWKHDLDEDAGLPENLLWRFDALVKGGSPPHLDARLMLTSRLVWLYRIDPSWCQQYLVEPMASFEPDVQQAVSLWQAFLWPAQVSSKLWGSLKPALWSSLRHFEAFPDSADRLLDFFAAHLLHPGAFDAEIDRKPLADIFSRLGPKQLAIIARQFETDLRARGLDAAQSWRERIGPFFETYWPLSTDKQSPGLSARLSTMLLQTREAFPEATSLLLEQKPVIGRAKDIFGIVYPLTQEKASADLSDQPFPYAERFPQDLLRLLHTLVVPGTTEPWHSDRLKRLLDQLCQSDPSLENTDEMENLRAFLRQA